MTKKTGEERKKWKRTIGKLKKWFQKKF